MRANHRLACIAVATSAVATLVWSILIFFCRWPNFTSYTLHLQAFILVVIWALGPAVWFAVEYYFWRGEENLAVGQQYARDFWIGAGAMVLVLAADYLKSLP